MSMASEQQRPVRSFGDRNIPLALVVVILSVSVAVSGWIIITALDQLNSDPFEEERVYDIVGTMMVDGAELSCTGDITSHYSSETDEFRIFTYHATYGSGDVRREASFSLMFDSDKRPSADLYEPIGTEGDYELWYGEDRGVKSIYYLDKDNLVDRIDFEVSDDHLRAVVRLKTV